MSPQKLQLPLRIDAHTSWRAERKEPTLSCVMVEHERCSHGKRNSDCAEYYPCPHGKRKRNCVECNGCPHGKVRGN